MVHVFRDFAAFLFLVCLGGVYCVDYQPKPITITEDNWAEILEGEWMIEFMAPWCPACRSFKETWSNLAKWGRDLDIQVGVIDVTESPGLSGRFLVTALPSIYHVKDGIFRQYVSSRGEKELISFVDDKKWKEVEPVSKWTAPDTIQMSLVGTFFKVAMKIRSFYSLMTEEYGIPEWGCYLIFAIITILAGLFIGLMLVCLCDLVFPAKKIPPPIPADLMNAAEDKVLAKNGPIKAIFPSTFNTYFSWSNKSQGDIIDDTEVPDGDTVRQRKVETARSSQKDGDEDQDSQDSGSSEMNKESDKKKDL